MVFPTAHIIAPMLIVETYRRYFSNKRFSRWYVFLAGLLGAAPDFDFIYGLLVTGRFDMTYHRGLTHSLWFPIAALIVGLVIYTLYSKNVIRYEGWNVSYAILFVATVGLASHVLLDGICGFTQWFYPLEWSAQIPNIFMTKYRTAFFDGVLLLVWLLYDEEMLNDILCFLGLKKKAR